MARTDAGSGFRRLAGEEGKGVVVTLHDLTLAARFADRVLMLHQGRLVADGKPGEALTSETLATVYGVAARTHAGEVLVRELGRVTARTIELLARGREESDRLLARDEVAWIARIVWVSQ